VSALARLRALAEAATPGRWTAEYGDVVVGHPNGYDRTCIFETQDEVSADAEFAAAMYPGTALALLDVAVAGRQLGEAIHHLSRDSVTGVWNVEYNALALDKALGEHRAALARLDETAAGE